MKRYKRLIVPLGLQDLDSGAISWASRISGLAGSEHVLFIHASDTPDFPQKTKEKYPWLAAPLEETIREKMQSLVNEIWEGNPSTEISFEVATAKSDSIAILEAVIRDNSDLIIVGRGAFGGGMAVKLARKSPCSVMSVHTDHAKKLERILVPTDFSELSRNALDVATAFAASEGLTRIDSVHVCNIGAVHGMVTLPEEEQVLLAQDFAEELHRNFLKDTDLRGAEVEPHLVVDRSVPIAASRLARELDVNLIVTRCRGKNAISSWLLGSNAESLLERAPVPVIAAKVKGTGRNLLDSLLHG
jgi:nucleotide-binding universal stress UspA family protein